MPEEAPIRRRTGRRLGQRLRCAFQAENAGIGEESDLGRSHLQGAEGKPDGRGVEGNESEVALADAGESSFVAARDLVEKK